MFGRLRVAGIAPKARTRRAVCQGPPRILKERAVPLLEVPDGRKPV